MPPPLWTPPKPHRESGFLTMEAVIIIIVLVVLLPIAYAGWNMGYAALKSRTVAQQLVQVSEAARAYARSHGLIVSIVPGSNAVVINGSDLVDAGLLPHSGGPDPTNPWGHSYKIYYSVAVPPANTSPTLTVIVATIPANAGNPKEEEAVKAAGFVGASGGYFVENTSGYLVLRGVANGWEIPTGNAALLPPSTPGPLVGSIGTYVSLDDKVLNNDLLYRVDVPGRPELNQMHVDLDMRDNSLKNVGDIQFNATAVTQATLGDMCANVAGQPRTDGKVFYYTDQAVPSQSGLYACKDGKGFAIADSGNSVPVRNAVVVTTGSSVPKPICAAGTSPFITVAPAKVRSGLVPLPLGTSMYSSYEDEAVLNSWKVVLTAVNLAGLPVDVTGSTLSVMTSCVKTP